MRPVLIRLTELTILCVLLSSISCGLFYYQIIVDSDKSFSLALALAISVFVSLNVFMLRRFYLELPILRIYYFLNFIAYGMFICITAGVYCVFGEVIYAWMFSTLKLTAFLKVDHSTVIATVFSHIVMLFVIFVAPLDIHFYIKREWEAISNK